MITQVRAKMSVQSILVEANSDKVEMQAVMGGGNDKEDNSYSKYTPSGSLKLQVDNENVRGWFKAGKRYYIDITEVPEAPKVAAPV